MNAQTRWGSFLESCWNLALGMLVATLVWRLGVAPAIDAGYLGYQGWDDSFAITAIFTIVSLVRTFIVRRISVWWSVKGVSFWTHLRTKYAPFFVPSGLL